MKVIYKHIENRKNVPDNLIGFVTILKDGWRYTSIALRLTANDTFALLFPAEKVGGVNTQVYHPTCKEVYDALLQGILSDVDVMMQVAEDIKKIKGQENND